MCVPLLESGRFGILEDSSFLIGCICECFAETCSSRILCRILLSKACGDAARLLH